ncbi:zinc metalloprotease [Hanseniaspora opuntiae]
MNFGMNLFSRHKEYQADNYAAKLGKGEDLKKALIQLQITNLSTISVDKLFSMYHYSHPVLCERLEAIDKYTAEQEKKSD